MIDPHAACITEVVRCFEDQFDTSVEAMEWRDHACRFFKTELCKPHHRGMWVHPTDGQILAWQIQHETTGSL